MQGRLRKDFRSQIAAFFCFLALILTGCSSSLELSSKWTNQKFAISGDGSQWKDGTKFIAGPAVSVGFKNDNKYLYIGLITSSRATQLQMLFLGCTAWFDAEGKKNKTFGIQFPVSGLLQGRRFPTRANPEEIEQFINAVPRQLVICGPGENEQHRISLRDARGVEAQLGYADGTLTYELKVPLQRSKEEPYAINADTTKPLLVGIETGDLAEAMKGQSGASSSSQSAGGRGQSGRRSGGGSGAGSGGGADQGSGSEIPEPLKHWITVHLSNGSTAK